MAKAVVLARVGEITYRELTSSDIYKPTLQEEIDHGTKVFALQSGDPGERQITVLSNPCLILNKTIMGYQ